MQCVLNFMSVNITRNHVSEHNVCADDVDNDGGGLYDSSVVGVPSPEDWPQEVGLPQSAFPPRPPQPIEDLVPDMDELGKSLLLVSIWCMAHY